jgi:GTPase KRas
MNGREVKVCVFGGGGVGKSAVTIRFVQDHFIDEYDPTIEDSYRKQRHISETPVLFDILDTAGQEEFSYHYQDQWMRSGEAFVLMYSITSRTSFDEVLTFAERIWRIKDVDSAQMLEQCGAFIVVVGNKCDLEDDRQVSSQEGLELAQSIHASAFFETSARCHPGELTPSDSYHVQRPSYNVFPMFDYIGLATLARDRGFGGSDRSRLLERRLKRTSSALPWNWAKLYRWNAELKKLGKVHKGATGNDPVAVLSASSGGKNRQLSVSLDKSDTEKKIEGDIESLDVINSDVFSDLYRLFLSCEDPRQENVRCPFDVELTLDSDTAEKQDQQDGCGAEKVKNTEESKPLPAHAIVLALRSEYFRAQLESGTADAAGRDGHVRKLVVPSANGELTPQILAVCIRFCYNPRINPSVSLELLLGAQQANALLLIDGLDEVLATLIANMPKSDDAASGDTAPEPSSKLTESVVAFTSSASIQDALSPALTSFAALSDVALEARKDPEDEKSQVTTFAVHRALLVARSKWFEALLSRDFREAAIDGAGVVVTISMMSAATLGCVLEYLYTGRCEELAESPNVVLDVLEAANALNLERLINLCETTLVPLMSADNVCALTLAASFHNAEQLVKACEFYIVKHFAAVMEESKDTFKQLPDEMRIRIETERKRYDAAVGDRLRREEELRERMSKFRAHLSGQPEADYLSVSLP